MSARTGVVVALLGALVLTALTVPLWAPWHTVTPNLPLSLSGPSELHWLGCDEDGRDLGLLIAWGARTALLVATTSVALSAGFGALVGLFAGYRGGAPDAWLMRASEVVASFPGILLALLMLFVTQSPGVLAMALALSVTAWAPYARLVRASVLVERERQYVEAARALGIGQLRILLRHLLPNVAGPLVAQVSTGLGTAMVAEASLSFLGFGASGTASWGQLLEQGATFFLRTPHLAVFPSLAMMAAVLSFQMLGDIVRDRIDPRARP